MTTPPCPTPLEYASKPARVSPMALWAMILGIIGIPTGCLGILFGLAGLLLGIMAVRAINRSPDQLGGKGFAIAGIATGSGSIVLGIIFIAILIPGLARAREQAKRTVCMSNLHQICNGMEVYASDYGGCYPTPGYPASAGAYSSALAVTSTATNPPGALAEIPTRAPGNPMAGLWMLVVGYGVPSKVLLCPSDPFAGKIPAPLTDASGHYYLTPAAADQLSYSTDYPYSSATTVGVWWRVGGVGGGTLSLMSDMSPLDGTGKPARTLTMVVVANDPRMNSFNHNSAGQNVAFSDGSVEWCAHPYVSGRGDNIFTASERAGVQRAASPGLVPPITTTRGGPDVIMVPLRDGNTGAIR